jgi:hypothetical protein
MTTVFIAAMAFSLGLLAFCAGAWLTIWAGCTGTQYKDIGAARLTGYFITILAIFCLVFTSYYFARSLIAADTHMMPTTQRWAPMQKHGEMMKNSGQPGKTSAAPAKPTTATNKPMQNGTSKSQ